MITCSVCGTNNEEAVLFCNKCVSPINIQKISDYTNEDKDFMISLLLEAISKQWKQVQQNGEKQNISHFFDKYLNIYWLRPETAVWRTIEAEILNKLDCLREPLLDAGCGDGVNMSILKGNIFSPSFDTFQSVSLERKDIYDVESDDYIPEFIHKIENSEIYGIDIKTSLVSKAKKLGIYKGVLTGDIHNLPYENGTFKTVYSNVIKDFDNLNPILKEVHRVLQNNGTLILTTPNNLFQRNMFFINESEKFKQEGDLEKAQRFKKYDRGRSVYSATQKTVEEWKNILQQNGFVLTKVVSYAPRSIIKLFDIGTRAFSIDLLKKYHEYKTQNERTKIKQIFLPLIKKLFSPYITKIEDPQGSYMILLARKITK